jgi:hypothetical protein
MRPNVAFTAIVAIGLNGVAVMNLDEKFLHPDHVLENCECIQDDLDDIGSNEWLECLFEKIPSPGVYKIDAEAAVDADSTDYQGVTLAQIFSA